jgi:hypothetical protein
MAHRVSVHDAMQHNAVCNVHDAMQHKMVNGLRVTSLLNLGFSVLRVLSLEYAMHYSSTQGLGRLSNETNQNSM